MADTDYYDDDKVVATTTTTMYDNHHMIDMTTGTIDEDVSSSSLPNPEELRTSSTSRVVNYNSNKRRRSKTTMLALFGCIVMMIGLVVMIPTVVVSNNKNINTAVTTTDDDSMIVDDTIIENDRPLYDNVVQFIVSNRISSEYDLEQYLISPQSLAVDWLTNVDPYNVPVPSYQDTITTYTGYMYMVRYIMAVNYFALHNFQQNDNNNNITTERSNLNFVSNNHVCDWNTIGMNIGDDDMGLFCREFTSYFNNSQGQVPYMLHIDNQLSGNIPTENGLLTTLQILKFSNNVQLTNTIPTELCNLVNLQELELDHNELSGNIPDCLYEISNLQLLDISNNNFVGNIPQTLCRLTQLNELHLNDNQLIGNIPICFGVQSTLTQLVLSNNQLSGIIPNELCYLSNLLYLGLHINMLESSIPTCIGSLSVLQTLDLSHNALYGKLPTELGLLSNTLENIIIDRNQFSGDPTSILNQFTKLRILNLRYNQFEFIIDTMFLDSSKDTLQHLDISRNGDVAGPFPNHMLLSFPKLECLDISFSEISGDFTGLNNIVDDNTVLKVLAVNNNNMTGSIANLVKYTGLVYLDISDNDFTGVIESIMFDQLSQIRYLYLSNNPFTSGPIPETLGSLVSIEVLSLRNTNRTGPLLDLSNDDYASWTALKYIDFGSNMLEGTVPVSYRRLSELQYFIFFDNEFINGAIPDELKEMKQLVGVLLDSTSIDPFSIYTNLCPSISTDENNTGVAILVVDCMGECSTECSVCQCCDIQNPTVGCTPNILNDYDTDFALLYRRTTDYHTVDIDIASTYDNNDR